MIAHTFGFRAAILAIGLNFFSISAMAQESAYADLDACTKGEQMRLAGKGAVIGLLGGLGGAFASGNKDKAAKAALIGAAAGGAAGWATAYYTAIDTCKKMNPSWIPESSLVRDTSKSYAQVKKEHNYKPNDGILVKVQDINMPTSVRPGEGIAVDTVFDVMTPNDAETSVVLNRKLFVNAGGKEEQLAFPANGNATRTVEAGRNHEKLTVPVPPGAVSGAVYRVEMSASAGGKPPVTLSKSVTVI
jgi:hypothetical protein